MSESKVAGRYAKSLIELAVELNVLEPVKSDMDLLISTCAAHRDLAAMLKNPVIHGYKKLSVLKKIFGDSMNKLSISFIDIITRKGREEHIEGIARQFVNLYKINKGIEVAVITSANGLDAKLRAEVMAIVKRETKSEVELIEKVNKDLIGGFILRVGDKQFDASIAKSLRAVAKEFRSNPMVKN
ncbi:MAG: ATP synthase F1 subunit delta [Bacteroidota bacterium]